MAMYSSEPSYCLSLELVAIHLENRTEHHSQLPTHKILVLDLRQDHCASPITPNLVPRNNRPNLFNIGLPVLCVLRAVCPNLDIWQLNKPPRQSAGTCLGMNLARKDFSKISRFGAIVIRGIYIYIHMAQV